MKITISKNTIRSINTEVAEIATIITGETVNLPEIDFDKDIASVKEEEALKYFSLDHSSDHKEVVFEMDDEVIFIILEAYRVIAKPLAVIVSGVKMLMSREIMDQVGRTMSRITRKA
jgi:hypothetical protein